MKCRFCLKISTKRHYCENQFCYEKIFQQFFIDIMLDYKPKDFLEFFCQCMRYIHLNDMFKESENPSDVVRKNLKIFVNEYDCF